MIVWFLVAVLLLYTLWAARRVYLRKKRGGSHCSSCPYSENGLCSENGKTACRKNADSH